uniref:Uncharacterized protein n=1 Tax=Panagrolaimus davidi TaxID=227884 RepID=A0A914QDU4_9BILA
MSVDTAQFNNNNNDNEEEEEEASTSSLPNDGEDKTDPNHMSPSLCKEGMVKHFDNLVSHFSSIWKHHVANTNGIKESWLKFEDFYSNICQFTGGQYFF